MNSFARAQRTTAKAGAQNTAVSSAAPQAGGAFKQDEKKVAVEAFKHVGPGTLPG